MTMSRLLRPAAGLLSLVVILPSPAAAQWTSSRVDGHAPIGVMADHRHEAGEMMLSLRYMPMEMAGSRIGTTAVDDAEIVASSGQNFLVTPTSMRMTMIMAGVMYAPTDRLTLMAMVPYLDNSMAHITRAGGAFTAESKGIGDVSVAGLLGLVAEGNHAAHLTLGLSLPTGSIDETGVNPMSNGMAVQMPYPMQLGSGTIDLRPGITWLGQAPSWSWGAQASATVRTGENDRGWRFGHRADATLWLGAPLARDLSVSVRGAYGAWGDVKGSDTAGSVNPTVVPTARPDLRGGSRIDAGVGVNWYVHRRSGLRLAAEYLRPVYQDLHGPQLESDWTLVVGLQVVPLH
jgi:hypothetical protein